MAKLLRGLARLQGDVHHLGALGVADRSGVHIMGIGLAGYGFNFSNLHLFYHLLFCSIHASIALTLRGRLCLNSKLTIKV